VNEGAELAVVEDIHATVVGAQIVDLLLVQCRPEFLADELDHLQCVLESLMFHRIPFCQALPYTEAQSL